MSLLRAGVWLSAGIALGRLAGFVREALLARHYGLGADADAAVLVLTLPDSLLNILVGSAMGAALVPALAAQRLAHPGAEGQTSVDRLQSQVAVLALGLGVVLSCVVTLGSATVVHLLAPGLAAAAVSQCAAVVDIALWAIPLTVLSSVLGAGLQERERFATTSLGTLWFNGAVIVGLLIWSGTLVAIAWAMLVGAALRLLGQLLEWRAIGGGWRWGRWMPEKIMAVAYIQVLLAGAALVLLPLAGRWFASFAGEGAIAAWTYASKLFELPLQVLVTVFATALFPRFTRLLAAGDELSARALLTIGLQIVFVLAVAVSVAGSWFAEDLVRVAFTFREGPVASLTSILLLALPCAGATALLQAWYAARRDTRTPLIAGSIGVGLFLAAGWPVLQAGGLVGLAWLAVAQYAVVAALLAVVLVYRERLSWRSAPRLGAPAFAAGVAGAGVCLLSSWVTEHNLRLVLAVASGLAALAAGAVVLLVLRSGFRSLIRR